MRTGANGRSGGRVPARYHQGQPADLKALNAELKASRGIRAHGEGVAKLSASKLALVHVARRDLQLEEDIYRATLQDVARVSSSRELTEEGFEALMAHFERLGFKPKRQLAAAQVVNLGDRPGMATVKQVDYIRALFFEWIGRVDDATLMKWIEGRYHVSAMRFLDVVRAQKAIEGLKRMTERKRYAAIMGAVAQRVAEQEQKEQST